MVKLVLLFIQIHLVTIINLNSLAFGVCITDYPFGLLYPMY